MRQPFTINKLYRTYKGKKVQYFLYSINETSGLPRRICRDHQRKTVKAKNQAEAQMKVVEIIGGLRAASGPTGSSESLGEYAADWMSPGSCPWEAFIKGEGRTLSPSYMREYRKIFLNHVISDRLLSDREISDIRKADLIRYRGRLVEKNGAGSVARKAFKIVKQILKYAAIMDDIPHDPAVGLGDIKEEIRERGVVTMDEVKKIFPDGERGPWLDDQDRLAFFLAYSCGLRRGEVLGLRWKNVLFDSGAIRIEEALIDAEGRLGDPKKGKKRYCPLPPSVSSDLKIWHEKTRFPGGEAFVFCYQKRYRNYEAGHNFRPGWWRTRWRLAMEAAGIDAAGRNIVPHSLRHSVNTHLQDLGYSRDKIREALGWSGEAVQNRYTHSDMMDHKGQADLVEGIIKADKDRGRK